MEHLGFRLGGAEAEFVEVRLLPGNVPAGRGPYESWLVGQVRVSAGGFRAEFEASFEPRDFQEFSRQLRALHQTLAGNASFEPREAQLALKVSGNGRGAIEVTGAACDLSRTNRLTFVLTMDQTYLAPVLRQLEATLASLESAARADE